MTSLNGSAYDLPKRALDIVGSIMALVLTMPLQVVIGMLVAVKLGRPVIFRQPRPGRGGAVFSLRKFRTMLPVDEGRGWVTDEQRMTRFGRILRSTSLDELPTLFNVLRGDMSIIGPRPLLVAYLDRYTPTQARRHATRPGITGLAQVRGRNSIGWEEKFSYDLEYVDNRSFGLDLRILVETVATVLSRHGVNASGAVTMEEFRGTMDGELT